MRNWQRVRRSFVVGGLVSIVALCTYFAMRTRIANRAEGTLPNALHEGAARPLGMPGSDEALRIASAEVDEKNRASHAERANFERAGWKIKTGGTPPERRLLDLDPTLLPSREGDLRAQIASTTPGEAHVANLRDIARRATRIDTRFAAVEALGRSHSDAAREALIDLLVSDDMPKSDAAHDALAARIRPESISDSSATRVALLLDDPHTSERDRDQIAFTVALTEARDRAPLAPEVVSQLQSASRVRLETARQRIASPLPAGEHRP